MKVEMSDSPYQAFRRQVAAETAAQGADPELARLTREWMDRSLEHRYSYHFEWLGRPVIQYPQDMVALQELVWSTRPDLIVETGIAHGGSLILSASLLALLDLCDAAEVGEPLDPTAPGRTVVGVDIDIRPHNRAAVEAHPMAHRIRMIEGSSTAPEVVAEVNEVAAEYRRVMVCLDSNHTHDHVLAELEAYAPLTTVGCYCVVFDTVIENMPAGLTADRPWAPGDNPLTAVREYLKRHPEFEVDRSIDDRVAITVAPGGYLKRLR
jgi:cephalosporin hydroxylase